jgi:hypothetical protein
MPSMRSVSFAMGKVPPHFVASLKLPGPVNVLIAATDEDVDEQTINAISAFLRHMLAERTRARHLKDNTCHTLYFLTMIHLFSIL